MIGADGLHSVVARGVNAPTYDDVPTLTWIYYSYWGDVPLGRMELHRADAGDDPSPGGGELLAR